MSLKFCNFAPAMKLDLYINEALFLNAEEKDTLAGLMSNIRNELTKNADDIQDEKAFDDLDSNAVHNDDNYGTKNVHYHRRQDRGRHAGKQ